MVQGKANQWIHLLLPVLLAALHTLGDAPARSLTALAQRLGVSETDAATVISPLVEARVSTVPGPTIASASPLVPMTAPSGVLSAPKTLLNKSHVIAARKSQFISICRWLPLICKDPLGPLENTPFSTP
jgi:hypothetical protein